MSHEHYYKVNTTADHYPHFGCILPWTLWLYNVRRSLQHNFAEAYGLCAASGRSLEQIDAIDG